ncbi:putative ribosome biogenesis GTPase RsgA [compost metagenome]
MTTINMNNVGLTDKFIQESLHFKDLKIGRISSQYKDLYKVITVNGEFTAEISGKFRYEARLLSDYPAVGDFVMLDREDDSNGHIIIHHVLSRNTAFERKAAGTANDVQVVATNMDIVFICMALNNDYNLRRLERYLSIAWDSGATPVVVLTKADLCEDVQARINEVSSVAIGADVVVTTGLSEDGFLRMKSYIEREKTYAFIGSSGVGKSTLINRLMGTSVMETSGTRNDDKGRHTTTRRELLVLPDGGVIIDTPGMRELGIESADLSRSFSDIDSLALQCKFTDCSHQNEPKCAVQQAINTGRLSAERLASYNKLKKEAKYAGLNSKQIEAEKILTIFGGTKGIKAVKNYAKEKQGKRSK